MINLVSVYINRNRHNLWFCFLHLKIFPILLTNQDSQKHVLTSVKDFRISIIRKKTKLLEQYLEWVRMCIGVTAYLNFESPHWDLATEKWKNTLATRTFIIFIEEGRRIREKGEIGCVCVRVFICVHVYNDKTFTVASWLAGKCEFGYTCIVVYRWWFFKNPTAF